MNRYMNGYLMHIGTQRHLGIQLSADVRTIT